MAAHKRVRILTEDKQNCESVKLKTDSPQKSPSTSVIAWKTTPSKRVFDVISEHRDCDKVGKTGSFSIKRHPVDISNGMNLLPLTADASPSLLRSRRNLTRSESLVEKSKPRTTTSLEIEHHSRRRVVSDDPCDVRNQRISHLVERFELASSQAHPDIAQAQISPSDYTGTLPDHRAISQGQGISLDISQHHGEALANDSDEFDDDIDFEDLKHIEEIERIFSQKECNTHNSSHAPAKIDSKVGRESEYTAFQRQVLSQDPHQQLAVLKGSRDSTEQKGWQDPVTCSDSRCLAEYNDVRNSAKCTDVQGLELEDVDIDFIEMDHGLLDDLEAIESQEKLHGCFVLTKVDVFTDSHIDITAIRASDEREYLIRLVDDWIYADIQKRDKANVTATRIENGRFIVDKSGLFILYPEILISATSVADTLTCFRKSVLQERLRGSYQPTKILLLGTILHEIIQEALVKLDFSTDTLQQLADKAIGDHFSEIYALDEENAIERMRADISERIKCLNDWGVRYLNDGTANTIIDDRSVSDKRPHLRIQRVESIEEDIYSSKFGLKGVIDAKLRVTISNNESREDIVPLEIKTGKVANNISHHAQLTMYILMMSEQHQEATSGLLYYSETGSIVRLRPTQSEFAELLANRNALAAFIKRKSLPELKRSAFSCRNCYALDSCMILHKTLESGNAHTSGIDSLFNRITAHISQCHCNFIRHWENLLIKEEQFARESLGEIWELSGRELEARGRSLMNMTIHSISRHGDNRFRYTFVKCRASDELNSSQQVPDVYASALSAGDSVILSTQEDLRPLAKGRVISVRPHRIVIECAREIGAVSANFRSSDIEESPSRTLWSSCSDCADAVFRIDYDPFRHSMSILHGNLVRLCSEITPERTRELIIENASPRFRVQAGLASDPTLNRDQNAALDRVMSCEDYCLILGMPGTGKTSTIAAIIEQLAKQDKTVIVSAYTHSAVDNILMKLIDKDLKIVRLGDSSRIHPKIRHLALSALESKAGDYQSTKELYDGVQVVATTCLSICHPILLKKRDYCIVDEASQATLPTCLGPALLANKFVLVGDHFQLPPLVQSPEAAQEGLEISMFKQLSEANPDATVTLRFQYRMCAEIMSLSNEFIYHRMLKCGSDEVAKARLNIVDKRPLLVGMRPCTFERCWTETICDPASPVVFVDTDLLGFNERKDRESVTNMTEIMIIKHVSAILLYATSYYISVSCTDTNLKYFSV